MTHYLDIWTLGPEALRGYALGLRNTTANLGEAWAKTGMVPDDEMSIIISITRDAWQREAAIAEGFAGRLDAPEAKPQPVTPERVAAWAARFEAAAHREIPHQRWYRPHGKVFSYATLREAFDNSPEVQPAAIESSEWEGSRWAWEDAETGMTLADTREEAVGYMAEQTRVGEPAGAEHTPTSDEAAQTGLADAVAESLATPAPSVEPSVNTPATDTATVLLEVANADPA